MDTRFKPGQSGNSRGRPRGSKNLKTLFERELGKFMTVTENGRSARRTKGEVLVQRLAHDAIKGDRKSAELVLRLVQDLGVGEVGEGQALSPVAAADDGGSPDQATLRRIMRRFQHLRSEDESSADGQDER